MIERIAEKKLIALGKGFQSVAVIGPRQSGKTTLVRSVFPDKPYVSLENPDTRRFAIEDPRGFLHTYEKGAILDEVQRAPHLFSYLQEVLDESKTKGLFILTGSNNFQLQESISQSLAGRIAYLNLLPFSLEELVTLKSFSLNDNELMLNGFYPPIYDQEISSVDWSRNYISTYIEKDVRQIKNVNDLIVFERFLSLLAGRCGQELNLSALAVETGVDMKTIQSWIGILENSFIIFLLRPHYNNFKKTIVKRPKLYFYDTAMICSLLRITITEQLDTHPLRGFVFENLVVAELEKARVHRNLNCQLFYWRDKSGHEIDVVIDSGNKLLPIEIKSGMTISQDAYKNLKWWKSLTGNEKSIVLYAGKELQKSSTGNTTINWRDYLLGDFDSGSV